MSYEATTRKIGSNTIDRRSNCIEQDRHPESFLRWRWRVIGLLAGKRWLRSIGRHDKAARRLIPRGKNVHPACRLGHTRPTRLGQDGNEGSDQSRGDQPWGEDEAKTHDRKSLGHSSTKNCLPVHFLTQTGLSTVG